ncbi:hypothetical protein Tco_1196577, partial [Tanacetum coccineum]
TYSSSSKFIGAVPIASPTPSLFHDDPYMKVMQPFYTEKSPIPPPTIIPQSLLLNPQEFFLPEGLLPPKKRAELQQARAQISKLQKKQMGNNHKISLARFRITDPTSSITDLEHIINDIQIYHQEDKESLLNAINELKISQEGPMPPKRTSTSEAPTMTEAAIKKLVADSVTTALEAQAVTIANADNTNRNTGERETHVARKCSYKEFMSCQPINFKGTNGAVCLIRWFERTKSVFSRSNCTEDCKVKFATGTLTEEAISWWNSFA